MKLSSVDKWCQQSGEGGCNGGTRRSNGGTPKWSFHSNQDHSVIPISVPVMFMTRYEVRGRLVATAQQFYIGFTMSDRKLCIKVLSHSSHFNS